MPLINNKVGPEDKSLADEKAQVDSLIKVVACHRHLASCVGGCTDGLQLRNELRQTREKAQKLSTAICQRLTSCLRDKSLAQEMRKELEILWVTFSSSLELLHIDMCKVYNVADIVSVGNAANLVKTGLQGAGTEVAARALSWTDLNQVQSRRLSDGPLSDGPLSDGPLSDGPLSDGLLSDGLELEERCTMEREISHIDHMIEDMELKVNVLRWMVEPRQSEGEGGDVDPLSSDTTSLALLSEDEEHHHHHHHHHSHIFIFLILLTVVLVAITLSVCIVLFS